MERLQGFPDPVEIGKGEPVGIRIGGLRFGRDFVRVWENMKIFVESEDFSDTLGLVEAW